MKNAKPKTAKTPKGTGAPFCALIYPAPTSPPPVAWNVHLDFQAAALSLLAHGSLTPEDYRLVTQALAASSRTTHSALDQHCANVCTPVAEVPL
jgi:hypothetical protein